MNDPDHAADDVEMLRVRVMVRKQLSPPQHDESPSDEPNQDKWIEQYACDQTPVPH